MGYGLLKVVGTKPQVMTMGVIDLRKYGDHWKKCAVDVKIREGTGSGYGCCFEP